MNQKERLKEYAQNCYYSKNGKTKSKNIMKVTKKGYKNKHETATEISLKKKNAKNKIQRNWCKNMPK